MIQIVRSTARLSSITVTKSQRGKRILHDKKIRHHFFYWLYLFRELKFSLDDLQWSKFTILRIRYPDCLQEGSESTVERVNHTEFILLYPNFSLRTVWKSVHIDTYESNSLPAIDYSIVWMSHVFLYLYTFPFLSVSESHQSGTPLYRKVSHLCVLFSSLGLWKEKQDNNMR